MPVAHAFYRSLKAPRLLVVDPASLDPEIDLYWEWVEEAAQRFPHLYGALPLDAVGEVLELARDAAGDYLLPGSLAGWQKRCGKTAARR